MNDIVKQLYGWFRSTCGLYDAEYGERGRRCRIILIAVTAITAAIWTYHALDSHRPQDSSISYLLCDIFVVFGSQFQPIINAALVPCSVLASGLQLAHRRHGNSSRDRIAGNSLIQLIAVLPIILVLASGYFTLVLIFFTFPWTCLWPPFFIITPFWLLVYINIVYQYVVMVVLVFCFVIAEFSHFAIRINRIMSRWRKVSRKPASKPVSLRLATIQWNKILKDLNRSSVAMSPILLAFIPPYLVTGLLLLYSAIFLSIDLNTKSLSYTIMFPTCGASMVQLLVAAYIPWSSRRYPAIMYRTIRSLSSARFIGHRRYLLKCIEYGDLPPYHLEHFMSIKYHSVLVLILEISTYFLLLVTAIGRPD